MKYLGIGLVWHYISTKRKGRFFCAMNIRSPYLTHSINHSFGMIYHYMLYMYTCKHHSQVFISSSSFQRSSILRPCVRPKSINTFEGPNYRVTYSLFMCPYTSFISSLVGWPISKKDISNFSLVYTFGGTFCHSQEAINEILTHGIFHDIKFKGIFYTAYTFEKLFEVILW